MGRGRGGRSGRFAEAWGSCDRAEKRFAKPNNDVPCTAETRAKTRACQVPSRLSGFSATVMRCRLCE
eukprot:SM000005S17141  [mRNA]  locus=s5:295499:295699:- [translate_table: standard]